MVIGAAFGQIVSSFVENIMTPLLGVLLKGIHFEGLSYTIGESQITYGVFIQSVFDFFIIAVSIFLIIRLLMRFKRQEEIEAAEEEPYSQETLLT